MAYSDRVFKRAVDELKRRRENAENEQKFRQAAIYQQYPELADVCTKLERTSLEYLSIILKGGSDVEKNIEELKQKSRQLADTKRAKLKSFTGDEEYLSVKYSCPVCEDTGYRNGRRCSCFEALLKQYSAEEVMENCSVKLNDFADFVLDYYPEAVENGYSPREKMHKLFNYCRGYAANFSSDSPSLLFIGKTGLGKTFLSSCIAKELIDKGMSVVFGQFATFVRRIGDEHFGRAEGETIDKLNDCDLLILDDLGSEFKTPYTESALYEIINARINLERPTIISTNLTVNELNERYNERLISRITGCFVPFMFFGKDIRPMIRKF